MSWRKLHFWLGLVVLVQVILWIVSGVAFSVLPNDELQGLTESRQLKAAPLAVEAVRVSAPEIAASLEQRLGRTPDIQTITLSRRGPTDTLVFLVTLRGQSEPELIDARSGDHLLPLTASDARDIARSDFTGEGDVDGVEWIRERYQKGYDYTGPLPAYRVNFSNNKQTRLYISPYSGEILARRNIYRTVRNVFWTLHVFGYLDRDIQGNAPILVSCTISLIAVTSGGLLLVPSFRRRRVGRAAVVHRAPVLGARTEAE